MDSAEQTTEETSQKNQPKASSSTNPAKRKKLWITVGIGTLFVLFLAATAAAGYLYYQLKRPVVSSGQEQEVGRIMGEVGNLMELPTGTPTLATVTDKEKLASQPFFQRAENGDKVLFFTEAQKAVLYRPSTGKIIDVATINVAENKKSAGVEETPVTVVPTEPARLALYNGTAKKGLTLEIEKEAPVSDIAVYEVVAKENAAKNDYETTLVIALTEAQSPRAAALADAFGVGVSAELPEGETAPADTDILVILGKDRL